MLKRRTTVQDELLPGPRQRSAPRRTRRPRLINPRLLLRLVAAFLAVVILLYGGLALFVNGERLRPGVETAFSAAIGRRVEIRTLDFSLRHMALVAGDVSVGEDPSFGSRVPFLQARTVYLDVRFLPLVFAHRVQVTGVSLDSPIIMFRQNPDGMWNYSSLLRAANPGTTDFDPPSIRIEGGRLSISGSGDDARGIRLSDVRLTAPALSLQTAAPFTLTARVDGGGTAKLEGRVGPVEWQGGTPLVPLSGLVHVKDVNLAQSSIMAASTSVSGLLSLDGSLESDGRLVRVDGQANAVKLKMAGSGAPAREPLQAVFTLSHDLNAHSGVLNRCDFRVSKGVATLTGKYVVGGQSLLLGLDLSISGAPVTDLAPYLPAVGFPLPGSSGLVGGMVVADIKFEGPLEAPLASGEVSVDNTRLTGFNLSQRLSSIEGLDASDLDREIEIISWSAKVKSGDAGLGLDNVDAAVAGLGSLTGSGSIRLDCGLNFKMSGIRGLTGPKGTPIPFTIQGTCTDPIFRPVPRT